REIPVAIVGERRAFYRVLLGHQDHARTGKGDVGGLEGVVIGERMAHGVDAERSHLGEKALGMAGARDRVHGPARPRLRTAGGAPAPPVTTRRRGGTPV